MRTEREIYFQLAQWAEPGILYQINQAHSIIEPRKMLSFAGLMAPRTYPNKFIVDDVDRRGHKKICFSPGPYHRRRHKLLYIHCRAADSSLGQRRVDVAAHD